MAVLEKGLEAARVGSTFRAATAGKTSSAVTMRMGRSVPAMSSLCAKSTFMRSPLARRSTRISRMTSSPVERKKSPLTERMMR